MQKPVASPTPDPSSFSFSKDESDGEELPQRQNIGQMRHRPQLKQPFGGSLNWNENPILILDPKNAGISLIPKKLGRSNRWFPLQAMAVPRSHCGLSAVLLRVTMSGVPFLGSSSMFITSPSQYTLVKQHAIVLSKYVQIWYCV